MLKKRDILSQTDQVTIQLEKKKIQTIRKREIREKMIDREIKRRNTFLVV